MSKEKKLDQKFKNTAQFCAELNCSSVSLWRYERNGKIPKSRKLNGQKYWDIDAEPIWD